MNLILSAAEVKGQHNLCTSIQAPLFKEADDGKPSFLSPLSHLLSSLSKFSFAPRAESGCKTPGRYKAASHFQAEESYRAENRAEICIYGMELCAGSKCSDCMAWTFCGPCALCQETRTLAKNNVHNGVWYGKTVLPAPTAGPLQAPTPVTTPTKPV